MCIGADSFVPKLACEEAVHESCWNGVVLEVKFSPKRRGSPLSVGTRAVDTDRAWPSSQYNPVRCTGR